MPIKFAAKKIGWSQSDKGFVIRLLVAPDDDWMEAANSPLGSPFGVVMVPIDPETGISKEPSPGADSPPRSPDAGQQRGEAGKPGAEIDGLNAAGRRKLNWSQMPRAQRAGIRCGDVKFQLWLSAKFPKATGTPAEILRAACGVHSRADLNESPEAAERFDRLDTQFMQDTGQLAEVRG